MGRDSTIYFKNRKSGAINSQWAARSWTLEFHQGGIHATYAGHGEVTISHRWVSYSELKASLNHVLTLYNLDDSSDEDSMIRDGISRVLEFAKARASSCDFMIIAEDETEPLEIQDHYKLIYGMKSERRTREQKRIDKSNAREYLKVKSELAARIKNQWQS